MNESKSRVLHFHNRGDTRRFGRRLSDCLEPGDLIVLEGDLGAGKTFLVRAIARGLGVPADVRITSPTFDLVHELPGRLPLWHLDLYRLDHPESLRELGIGEPGGGDAVLLVEWGDRFADALGNDGLWLRLDASADTRRCVLEPRGPRGARLLARLESALVQSGYHGLHCRQDVPTTPD